MNYLNEISAIVALVLMGLVCRGFAPHMKLSGTDPVIWLMRGIFVGCAGIALRIAFFDVIRPIMRAFNLLGGQGVQGFAQIASTGFNIAFAVSAYMVLKGLHSSLPEVDRANYTWLTAPFYPAKINLYRRMVK